MQIQGKAGCGRQRGMASVFALGMVLLWGGPLLAQQAANKIDTGFQPSKDLPAVPNQKGSGFAVNGRCNGIDEMAQSYYRWRKQNPNSPDMATITRDLQAKQGQSYVDKTLDLVTAKSFARGVLKSEPSFASRNPAGFEHKLVQQLQATHEPQSITLTPPPGAEELVPHRMTVYGAQKIVTSQGEFWEFKVADSNQYRQDDPGRADKVRLVYTPGSRGSDGHWSETVDGKEVAAWHGGDVVHAPADRPSDYVEILQRAQKGDKLGEIRRDLKIPEHPLDQMQPVTVVKDPKVGGVMLRIDPSLFSDSVPEADLQRLEERYRAFLAQDQTGAAVFRLQADRQDLRLVPLKSLLGGAQTLGELTRVRGYVRNAAGEISLVGLAEPGKPPIPLDDLVVALRAAYRSTATPYISLDPDPKNIAGPQKVRVGEIPADVRNTVFVRAMVEADYLMKRISLGKAQPKAEGFQRLVDILASGDYGGGRFRSRLWLTPLVAPTGDVLVTRRNGAEAVLFESHVQVQSEEMMNAGDRLLGTGGSRPDVDLAADQLTRHFDELAQEFPEFASLQQVFDVTKLAVAWRVFGVKSADIEALADRKPATVRIDPTYPGIGPVPIAGKNVQVSGGATAEHRIYRKAAVETDCLAPLLEAAGQKATVPVTLPEEMDLGVGPAVACQIDAYISAAWEALDTGDCQTVIERTSAVLDVVPDHWGARQLRADAYTLLGRLPEARADYDVLVASDPEAYAHRALLRARMDDGEGARKDLAEAQRLAPESDRVRYLAVMVFMEALDLPNATHALDTYATFAPLDPRVTLLRSRLADLKRRKPEDARRYLRLQASLPPRIALAFTETAADQDYADVNIPQMLDVLALVEDEGVTTPAELEIPYRARLGLLYGYAAQGARSPDEREKALALGEAVYQRLIQRYPDRAMPHIVRAQMAAKLNESPQTVADYLRKAAPLSLDADRIYSNIRLAVGTDRILDSLAVELWNKISRPEARANELLELVREHSHGAEAELIQAMENESEIDLADFIRTGTDSLNTLPVETKRKDLAALLRLTHHAPENLPAFSPLTPIVSRLFLYVSVLKLQLNDHDGFPETTFRGVAALQRTHAAIDRPDSPGKSLGILLMIYSIFEFKYTFESMKAQTDKLDELDRRSRALAGPPRATMARVQAEFASQAKLFATTWRQIAARYHQSMAQMQSHGGPLAATLCELMPALFQDAATDMPFPPAGDIIKAYPNIVQTKAFQAAMQEIREALAHAFTPHSADELYQQALTQCKDGSNFETVAMFLESIRELNQVAPLIKPTPALTAKLTRWEQEARYRSEQ